MGVESYRSRATKLAAAASALNSTSGVTHAPFSLAFLTDRRRIARPELILRALPAGAAVIYRDYDDPQRAATAKRLSAICKLQRVHFLIGDDLDLADAVGAGGAHMPARTLEAGRAERKGGLLTVSCHNLEELHLAARAGADLAFLGPVYSTLSHPGSDYLGVPAFKALAEAAPLPVLALGGIGISNAHFLSGLNIAGFGAIGAFLVS